MKSYKECPRFDKSLGRRKGYLADCEHAVNCRACRRCPQAPQRKLKLWAEERKQAQVEIHPNPKVEKAGEMLTTPFSVEEKSLITTESKGKSGVEGGIIARERPTSREQGKLDYLLGN